MVRSTEPPQVPLINRLAEREESVAVAESCTGGGLGAALTSVPGASAVFLGGVIAYADEVKRSVLGVSSDELLQHGAVSRRVAERLAENVRTLCRADWGIGITGVAGPGGGSAEKPVGTVWIAVAGPRPACESHQFDGDREAIREQAVKRALRLLARSLDTDLV